MFNRVQLIQSLMKQKNLENYLEIGVFNGHAFFKIKSKFKIAIDPEFRFDLLRKVGKTILNPYNLYNKYFQKTSDDFFKEDAPDLFSQKKIQISLIDGMHEYDFALRDAENTLNYLSNDGVIILHDCNPQTKVAAGTFEEWESNGNIGTWNGDIWKTILHLRCFRDDINVFTLDCDHGLGIVTKGKPENKLNYNLEEIHQLKYEDFNTNRKQWLNLKPAEYAYDFFNLMHL
ncbi:MAG: class I SAM-dependent methyltransferase [Bacteroidota bacterium]|jgi:hypothetical protein|nr:class I SAM-dependent methyltransferase [Bacteroidota bacterium]